MNVDELVRATLRRKLACLVAVLCALGAAAYGYTSATVTYESSAVAVVYPPGAGDLDAKLNPFVNLNDNMAQLAAVTATLMQSAEAGALVEEAGAEPVYTVTSTLGDTASALRLSPQISITTTADTPEGARAGAQALLDFSSVALARLQVQTGVRPNTEASITTAVMPGPGTVVPSSPVRAAGAYGLGVLIVGMLAVVCVGTILDRKRASASVAASGEPPVENAMEKSHSSNDRPASAEPVPAVFTSIVDAPAEVEEPATMPFAAEVRGSGRPASEADRAVVASAPQTVNSHIPGVSGQSAGAPRPTVTDESAAAADDMMKASVDEANSNSGEETATSQSPQSPWLQKRADPEKDESDGSRTVRPPERKHSVVRSRPPLPEFDPFNVPGLRDPRTDSSESDHEPEPFPAQETTPVRELSQEIDDYYGVEERVHVPIRTGPTRESPWSSATRGPRR